MTVSTPGTLRTRTARRVVERGGMLTFDGDTAVLEFAGQRLSRPVVEVVDDSYPELDVLRGTTVLADHVDARRADALRRSDAWFVDTEGRMFVQAPGVLIDVFTARRTGRADASRATARTPSNLMSPSRARVVFALLAWPGLSAQPVRTIAAAAGASSGLAGQVVAALEADRHLTAGRERLLDVGGLLDQWATSYARGLGRSIELGRFSGPPDLSAWERAGTLVHVSGEAAIDSLVGPDLVLYVPELDLRSAAASRWRSPRDGGANIVVRRRFWSPPLVGEVGSSAPGAPVRAVPAPAPLVYADLIASGDPRQREAARDLKESVVGRHES